MEDAELIPSLERRAAALRRHIVSVAAAQFAHLGGSMSCADLMAALFFHWLDVEGTRGPRDRFLLSKGHAVHALHACLVELGKVDAAELPALGRLGSRLGGHPTKKAPGVEFATGSLGHALSVGVGIAMAEQLNRSSSRTVVMLGDGELQEGQIDAIDVWTLLAIQLDRDIMAVHDAADRRIGERLALHDTAPMTSRVSHRKKDGFLLASSLFKGFLTPGIPIYGVVRVHQKIWAGFAAEPVGVNVVLSGIRDRIGRRF